MMIENREISYLHGAAPRAAFSRPPMHSVKFATPLSCAQIFPRRCQGVTKPLGILPPAVRPENAGKSASSRGFILRPDQWKTFRSCTLTFTLPRFVGYKPFIIMAKLADTADLKSAGPKGLWGFDSPSRHQRNSFRGRRRSVSAGAADQAVLKRVRPGCAVTIRLAESLNEVPSTGVLDGGA
jgi:hypothetical protein